MKQYAIFTTEYGVCAQTPVNCKPRKKMEIETDLNIIKRNSEIREEENFEFRSFLKGQDSDKIDKMCKLLH